MICMKGTRDRVGIETSFYERGKRYSVLISSKKALEIKQKLTWNPSTDLTETAFSSFGFPP